ncbi:MAG: diacylglycerol kinase family protein [Candidatus Kerfeldbacteria bacterium]|nr:diacylglycerol kinase family protein [Candidatus Kerfeldbacteria bacterium]
MSLVSPTNFLSSLRFAIQGVRHVFKHERNFRIHTIFALFALFLAVLLRISITQWLFVITAIASVLVLEIVNSIFERLLDLVQPRAHHYVAAIKDLMAAAVVVASISALAVGLIIFLPLIILRLT